MNLEGHSIFWNLQLFFQCLNIFILQAFHFLSWVYSVVCFFLFVCFRLLWTLLPFSLSLSFVYSETSSFPVLILYAATLLSVFISHDFLVLSLVGFFYKESLYALLISSSPVCILPYSSLVLLPQLRTHPFVVPGLSGDAEVFLWWLRDSALCLYPYPCQNFYCEGMLYFVKGSFGII